MISHKYKCIFIHIPATGGTSIEVALCGTDLHKISPMNKHMSSDIARILYAQYWNKYFKFSYVRNPFDWFVSQYYYALDLRIFSFKEYIKSCIHFGSLHWNYPRDRIYIPLYKNVDDMDYIGKFETLHEDFRKISARIGFNGELPTTKYHKRNRKKDYRIYYDEETREIVEKFCAKDLELFNYEFNSQK